MRESRSLRRQKLTLIEAPSEYEITYMYNITCAYWHITYTFRIFLSALKNLSLSIKTSTKFLLQSSLTHIITIPSSLHPTQPPSLSLFFPRTFIPHTRPSAFQVEYVCTYRFSFDDGTNGISLGISRNEICELGYSMLLISLQLNHHCFHFQKCPGSFFRLVEIKFSNHCSHSENARNLSFDWLNSKSIFIGQGARFGYWC